MESRGRVHGTLAAAVTPLGVDGSIDADGIRAVVDFYARAGLDGFLALGTTGEGVLFSVDERRFAADEFVTSAHHRLAVVVHCGAQTTHDTVALAKHAASHACAPLPFYVYEFAPRSGYAVPIDVVERLRSSAPNLAGLKVSDSPFESVKPYLLPGLDVFIGAEGLIAQGMALGAAGSVSGLAGALPELTIDAVESGTPEASARAARVRATIEPFPFHSALKFILQCRGVAIEDAVRRPLRTLNDDQRDALRTLIADPAGEIAGILAAA
jgi:dihydrodipicolinate synthase/N-acetylneuraminate lyase